MKAQMNGELSNKEEKEVVLGASPRIYVKRQHLLLMSPNRTNLESSTNTASGPPPFYLGSHCQGVPHPMSLLLREHSPPACSKDQCTALPPQCSLSCVAGPMNSRGLLHVNMGSLALRCRECRFGVGAEGVDDPGEGRQAHFPGLGLAPGSILAC